MPAVDLRGDLERHLAAHHSSIHSRHRILLTNVSPLNNRRQYLLCQYGDRLLVIRSELCQTYLIKAVVPRIGAHLFELFDAIARSAGDETGIHHCIRDDWRDISMVPPAMNLALMFFTASGSMLRARNPTRREREAWWRCSAWEKFSLAHNRWTPRY